MKVNIPTVYRPSQVYVCFGGRKTHWWTMFLKKGFYHCFIIFSDTTQWILIDPVLSCTDLIVLRDEKELFDTLKEKGYKWVKTTQKISFEERSCFFMPMTCVEIVKHFLGINNFFILTPYQLYKFVTKKWKGRDE